MAVPVSQATVDRLNAEKTQAQADHDAYASMVIDLARKVVDIDAILADVEVAP